MVQVDSQKEKKNFFFQNSFIFKDWLNLSVDHHRHFGYITKLTKNKLVGRYLFLKSPSILGFGLESRLPKLWWPVTPGRRRPPPPPPRPCLRGCCAVLCGAVRLRCFASPPLHSARLPSLVGFVCCRVVVLWRWSASGRRICSAWVLFFSCRIGPSF